MTASLAWQSQAACRDTPTAAFFADGPGDTRHLAAKRNICGGCPVTDQCLTWALETGDTYAVLGGMTPQERQPLLRARGGRTKSCRICGTRFITRAAAKDCSPDCRRESNRRRMAGYPKRPHRREA